MWWDGLEENARRIIEDIIKDRNFINYEITITEATKKGDNYLGLVHRVNVVGTRYGKPNTKWTFIMKRNPAIMTTMAMDKFYQREHFAYKTMLPYFRAMEMDFGVQENDRFSFTPLLGGDMTARKEIIFLDDLKPEGFVMANKKESLTFEQMVLLYKSLAHLHSFSFAMKKYNPELFDAYAKKAMKREEIPREQESFMLASCRTAIDAMENEQSKKILKNLTSNIFQEIVALRVPSDEVPYKVLAHGDCWTNNFMFKYHDDNLVDVRILDWQIMKYTYPVLDLAILMFSSIDEKVRGHYEELLDIYYDHLKLCLRRLDLDINDCYPEDVYRNQIHKVMRYGMLMGIFVAPLAVFDEVDSIALEAVHRDVFDENVLDSASDQVKQRYLKTVRGIVNDFVRLNLL